MTRRARAAALALAVLGGACSRVRHVPPQQGAEGEPGARPGAEEGRGGGVPPVPGRPRVPASPQGLLAPGAVAELQRALARRGLLGAHDDGKLDDATTAAVRRFQAREKLAETGFPDRETLRQLGVDPERAYVEPRDRERARGGERSAGEAREKAGGGAR